MAEFAHLKSAIGDDYYLHLKKVFNSVRLGHQVQKTPRFWPIG